MAGADRGRKATPESDAGVCEACTTTVGDGDETYLHLTFGDKRDPRGTLTLCRDCFSEVAKLTVNIELVDPRPPAPTPGAVYGFEENLDPIVHIETVSPREDYGGLVYATGETRITIRTRSGINIPVSGDANLRAVTIRSDAFDKPRDTQWLVYQDINGKTIGHPLDPNYTHRTRTSAY